MSEYNPETQIWHHDAKVSEYENSFGSLDKTERIYESRRRRMFIINTQGKPYLQDSLRRLDEQEKDILDWKVLTRTDKENLAHITKIREHIMGRLAIINTKQDITKEENELASRESWPADRTLTEEEFEEKIRSGEFNISNDLFKK